MRAIETELPGVLILEPRVFEDDRGHFLEIWNRERYAPLGIPTEFVQDNVSVSSRGVLRGLHFQLPPHAQGKLVSVLQGTVWDVAVDVRAESPTYGKWVGVELTALGGRQFWIPPGFAHGFQVLSEAAVFHYKCTDHYAPECERSVRWDDPALGIRWPLPEPVLSPKDAAAEGLREITGELALHQRPSLAEHRAGS